MEITFQNILREQSTRVHIQLITFGFGNNDPSDGIVETYLSR